MPARLLALLALLFFFSGVAALIYQVMWLRLLALVFGVTVYAASTVLASFMGGLALGSYLAGRAAARLRAPLRAFGLVEIGVGLSALATPLLLEWVRGVWIGLQPVLPSSLFFLTPARFVVACVVLIVPTTLMGATLPIVMRSALVTDAAVGSRIGLLYATNTCGAIIGALIAGFYLVSEMGVARSFQLAAAINVTIGILAIIAAARPGSIPGREGRLAPAVSPSPSVIEADSLTAGQRRAVLWTFVLSGMLSLALEIVWFRMLITLLRPTAYAFTVMLATVLAGIALGSALAAPLLRRGRRWMVVLTIVQLLISIAAVLSLNALTRFETLERWLSPPMTAVGVDPYVAPLVAASLVAMLPTTMLLGFAFPIGLALWAGHVEGAPRRIGLFYSLNVCGAIAGSVLGGFVLLPMLGSRGSLLATSALALVSSVMLARAQFQARPNFAGFMAIVGPVAFVMSALNAVDPFAITSESAHQGERVMWREEGVQTTVAVHEVGEVARPQRVMYLDGMHQASDFPNMAFVHQRIGALPMLLHPEPRDALVVGLGGGATAGAVAQYLQVSVDVVELSRAVVGGARFFNHINFDLLTRPTVTLRVDDGRNYLLTTPKRYDVVTADIILPRHAGAGALYSREYFELVRHVLKDGGLVLQWNGGEGVVYRMILRTFMAVFPNTTLWADGTLMLGSVEPFSVSRRRYEDRRGDPQVRALFDWDYDTLLQTYFAGPRELAAWVGDGPLITDDRPRLEYFLSLPVDPEPAPLASLRTTDVSSIVRP
ncbi:MAG: fused MFS/spermidine synthase [Acidobacteriota bacterium]